MGLADDAKRLVRDAIASAAIETAGRASGRTHIALDYPPNAANVPRYGHGRPPHARLRELIAARDDEYERTLAAFAAYADELAAIPVATDDPTQPRWVNGFLPGLDGVALYGFLRERTPALYLEIGSGNSTRFVSRARRDGAPATKIVSIDPYPRAEIDALCDEVIRAPLESADPGAFARLAAGDVLFFDGSHRVFMNSDVTSFFLDVLPAVAPGVLVGVHDVYLPDDYPPDIADRFYSEQYMLAAYLLGGADVEIALPAHHVSTHPQLGRALDGLWSRPGLEPVERHGVSFWFVTR